MSELKQILERYGKILWDERTSFLTDEADALYDAMIPGDRPDTLCWGDLDYEAQNNAFWPAFRHLGRILEILALYGKDRLLEDKAYAANMKRALNWWLAHDYRSTNWWHNEIGVPQNISNIAMMMYDVLDADMLAQATDWVSHGSAACNPGITGSKEKVMYWTGANLAWGMINTIRHALLTEDENLLRMAVQRLEKEITCDLAEGIQSDGSFFQHGPRLYSGGYGLGFSDSVTLPAYLLQGTPWQFSREKLDVFLKHMLDGLYHMTHCGALDNACIGREITRPDVTKGKNLTTCLKRMTETADMPRKDEIRRFLAISEGGQQPDRTKFFPDAMYLCHHFDGLHVGAKYLNSRLVDAEICNGENVLAFNMSYGTHSCIMRDGSEYLNINPVWDFSRIPGTTARTETDEQLLTHTEWSNRKHPNDHTGGGQEGSRAVIYELAQHDGVDALAAGFAFEHGFVFLGCGVKCTERPEALTTTLDQCLLQGDVTTDGASVLHHGIRYTALDESKIEVESGLRHGSWLRNSTLATDHSPVEKDVLTLTITHPAGQESSYAYMISAADQPLPIVQVLRNDSAVQAILLPDGSVMAIFHRADKIEWNGRSIEREAGVIIEPAAR